MWDIRPRIAIHTIQHIIPKDCIRFIRRPTGADATKGGLGLSVMLFDEVVKGFETVVFQSALKDFLALP